MYKRYIECNVYHLKEWNWQAKFKSWIGLSAFPFMLMPFWKPWIFLFFPQSIIVGQTAFISSDKAISQGEGKLRIQISLTLLKKMILCHILLVVERWCIYIYIYIYIYNNVAISISYNYKEMETVTWVQVLD